MTIRIKIHETDFFTLVSGGIVTAGEFELMLQDFGFHRMIELIIKAYEIIGSKKEWICREHNRVGQETGTGCDKCLGERLERLQQARRKQLD